MSIFSTITIELYLIRPIFKYDKESGFGKSSKTEVFDITNFNEASNQLDVVIDKINEIKDRNISAEEKKGLFDNILIRSGMVLSSHCTTPGARRSE